MVKLLISLPLVIFRWLFGPHFFFFFLFRLLFLAKKIMVYYSHSRTWKVRPMNFRTYPHGQVPITLSIISYFPNFHKGHWWNDYNHPIDLWSFLILWSNMLIIVLIIGGFSIFLLLKWIWSLILFVVFLIINNFMTT